MTQNTGRLDRIEALLATVAASNAASTQRLDRTEKIVEPNARAIEAWSVILQDLWVIYCSKRAYGLSV